MLIFILIVLFLSAVIGLTVYLVFGTIVASLIAFVATAIIIGVCCTVIILFKNKKKNDKNTEA